MVSAEGTSINNFCEALCFGLRKRLSWKDYEKYFSTKITTVAKQIFVE